MVPDSVPAPASTVATPMFTPDISRPQTPFAGMSPAGHIKESLDYLSAPVGRLRNQHKPQARVGGSRALESFVKLIASLEGFFHPNNSGSWTADVSRAV
jgi:proteasome activator subunit 4